MTYQQLIEKYNLKFKAIEVPTRPDGFMGDSAYHFKCRISKDGRGFNLYFSKGNGLGPAVPEFADVLDCLASDASTYENTGTFENWAGEYGYDADSRTAEKTYKVIKRQVEQLKRTIGNAAFSELLWETERL